jgi:hypothetical protein
MLISSYASFVNALALYRIGSNPVGLESTPSFTEVNFPLSLDQGKHQAYPSLGLLLSSPLSFCS